ncbi:MAG: hypothetical protein ACK559_12830, partial [bacterium]
VVGDGAVEAGGFDRDRHDPGHVEVFVALLADATGEGERGEGEVGTHQNSYSTPSWRRIAWVLFDTNQRLLEMLAKSPKRLLVTLKSCATVASCPFRTGNFCRTEMSQVHQVAVRP